MKYNRTEQIISVISGSITIGTWFITVIVESTYQIFFILFSIIITLSAMSIMKKSSYYKGVKMSGKNYITIETHPVTISINFDKEYKNPPRVEIKSFIYKNPEFEILETTTKGFTVQFFAGSQRNSFKNGIKWVSYGELLED